MKEKESRETVKMPRTHIEGALYYATSRGDHNEDIFKDSHDFNTYLDLLKKYNEQYGFKLFSFVLMPNHLHLLIELKEGLTISAIMHDLNANYTKYFNGKYERKGHLFQERYKMVLLEKERYLVPVSIYIHLNPQILGLVADAKEYAYSSLPFYAGLRSADERFTFRDEAAEMSSCLNGGEYKDVLSAASRNENELLGKELSKKSILGSEAFIRKVREYVEMSKAAPVESAQQPGIEVTHPQRRFLLAGVMAVAVMGILTLSLYVIGVQARDKLNQELEKKEAQISARLAKDREFIHKDLEEKYQADMVSYQAMAKRLELEKQKVRTLEDKMDKGGVKQ
ncbi:MAG: transposase [Candidatus Omnitrophota bacterium]